MWLLFLVSYIFLCDFSCLDVLRTSCLPTNFACHLVQLLGLYFLCSLDSDFLVIC